MSPAIINELITLLGHQVLRYLNSHIKQQRWYSIIADEETDITNKEQFNILIRYVNDSYEIYKEPLGFVEVPSISSNILCDALRDVLTRC